MKVRCKFDRKYRVAIFTQEGFFEVNVHEGKCVLHCRMTTENMKIFGRPPKHNHPKTTMIAGTRETWARQATLRIFMKKKFLQIKVTISLIQCILFITNCGGNVPKWHYEGRKQIYIFPVWEILDPLQIVTMCEMSFETTKLFNLCIISEQTHSPGFWFLILVCSHSIAATPKKQWEPPTKPFERLSTYKNTYKPHQIYRQIPSYKPPNCYNPPKSPFMVRTQ